MSKPRIAVTAVAALAALVVVLLSFGRSNTDLYPTDAAEYEAQVTQSRQAHPTDRVVEKLIDSDNRVLADGSRARHKWWTIKGGPYGTDIQTLATMDGELLSVSLSCWGLRGVREEGEAYAAWLEALAALVGPEGAERVVAALKWGGELRLPESHLEGTTLFRHQATTTPFLGRRSETWWACVIYPKLEAVYGDRIKTQGDWSDMEKAAFHTARRESEPELSVPPRLLRWTQAGDTVADRE